LDGISALHQHHCFRSCLSLLRSSRRRARDGDLTPGRGSSGRPQVAERAPPRETEWAASFSNGVLPRSIRSVHYPPHPQQSADDRPRGEAFLEKMKRFLQRGRSDPASSSATRRSGHRHQGENEGAGRVGMTAPAEYGGLGLHRPTKQGVELVGRERQRWVRCCRRTSRSVSRSR